MKISCDVIRDLLPLYAEDMVSEDSVKLIEEHLNSCPECAKELESLRQPTPPLIVLKTEDVLKRIRKYIGWFLFSCFIAAMLFALWILIMLFLLLV